MDSSSNEKVNEVYSYWFDGDQQVNYRTKWFPEGNTDIQSKADNEVNDLFGPLLNDALAGKLDSWMGNVKSCVALIVILDQLSRHVFRLQLQPPNSPLRIEADAKALRIAKQFHSDNDNLLNLSMAEYVFSLMPLRHTATVDHLTFILSNLKEKEAVEAKSMELLNKFRKQTVRRLQHLQDREKLEATDDILERSAFQANESDILANKLLKTTESFLLRQIKASDQSAEGVTLFISLSGGVDSMVLSKILVLLKAQHNSSTNISTNKSKLRIDKVVGIHIDYANRPESGRECAYVQQWCEAIGVEFRARVINEVTRGITSRDEYEKVAREIRYAFYVECLRENGVQAGTASSNAGDAPSQRVGVMFGHHIGDVQENVISNVMRGVSPLDLSGMTESSVSNGVVVWRPLLTHSKDEIYDFAHKYGVPYFKDSTPSWSTRGKLRNQLVPLLVDMYGEGCLRNLSALAAESDQVRDLVTDNIYAPFMNSVERFPCGLKVNILPFRYQPLCFWREVLKTLMHSMSMCMVRDKAVLNFVARIQKTTPGTPVLSGWLELRKGFHTMLTESGSLVILRDGVLYKDLPSVSPVTANQLTQRQAKRGAPKREVVETTPAAPASVSPAVAVVSQFSLRVNYNEHNLSESTAEDSDDVLHALALSFSQQSLDELNKVQFDQEATSDTSATSTTTSPKVLRIGSWEVTLEVVPSPYSKTVNPIDTADIADISAVPHVSSSAPPTSLRNLKKYNKKLTSDKDKLLSVLEEVLPGRFSYHILLSHRSSSSENGAFIDLSLFSNSHLVNTAGTFDVSACPLVALSADLHKMEGRLREGLPLLLPTPAAMSANSSNEFTTADSIHKLSACSQSLKLTYNYIGTNKHNAGSH